MATRRARAFGIIDLMGLVAAVGLAATTYRYFYPPMSQWNIWHLLTADWPSKVMFGTAIVYFTWPALLSAALFMVACSCVPWTSRRRVLRRPGPSACVGGLGTTAACLFASVWLAPLLMFPLQPEPLPERAVLALQVCRAMTTGGFAVQAVWTVLLMGRRWRPEPSWQDRAGRAVGIWWIVWAWSYAAMPHL